ncbi:MAG TPA: autotransporter outer membrane beta-barrel domain-containing protein, partial [Verrucomicrobiae bacterium]
LDVSTLATVFNLATNQLLKGGGTITGAVSVAGTLAPGGDTPGSLTANGNVTDQAGSITVIRLNKTLGTNDNLVSSGSIVLAGTLVVTNQAGSLNAGDNFKLFTANAGLSGNFSAVIGNPGTGLGYTFNPANGVLSVVTTMANNPTNISLTLSGSAMTLTWPADHLGWILQAQTNAASIGLFTNWVDVAGSSAGTQAVINLNPANPAVYFRLRHP